MQCHPAGKAPLGQRSLGLALVHACAPRTVARSGVILSEGRRQCRFPRMSTSPMKPITSALRRFWMLLAQAVTIGAGLLIAWRAFGPAEAPPPQHNVVAIHESTGNA